MIFFSRVNARSHPLSCKSQPSEGSAWAKPLSQTELPCLKTRSQEPAHTLLCPYRGLCREPLATAAQPLVSHRRADRAGLHRGLAPLANRAGALLPPHRKIRLGHRRRHPVALGDVLGLQGIGAGSITAAPERSDQRVRRP